MAAYTEPGVGANAVGQRRGRGCGSDAGAAGAKAPWVRDPNLPYTQEQLKNIVLEQCQGAILQVRYKEEG
jgi:hypothetical protein